MGIDIAPQPRYPYHFLQGNALDQSVEFLRTFDFVWASPPCQRYSALNYVNKNPHPDLVAPIRNMLKESGVPYCIENVVKAPLVNPIRLCGSSFGLKVEIGGTMYELRRHRHFECSFFALQPSCNHRLPVAGIYGSGEAVKVPGKRGFQVSPVEHRRVLMGMPWANRAEIAEAIPPAYGEFIGREALKFIEEQRATA